MTKLIGLTGLAGAGKNEAANALVGHGWSQDAFANRMRTAMLALDPIVWADDYYEPLRLAELVRDYGWDTTKREYPEVRRLLQKFGTEAGREIHGENCWVDALMRDWHRLDGTPVYTNGLVVTDVRFQNEAEAIRSHGGWVIEVVRPGLQRLPGNHASEAGFDPDLIDYTIYNDGTIDSLHEEMIFAIE